MNNDDDTITCMLTAGAESAHFTMSDVDGEDTIEMLADGADQGGWLLLKDRNGTNDFPGVELRGRDISGAGSRFLMRNGNGDLVLDFDANAGTIPDNTGILGLREHDGSLAWRFENDLFQGFDHAGGVTISYNRVTGAKNAVVETEHHGRRTLYCQESTGVWFEDFGRGQVQDGLGRVELDAIFLETVTIDDEHPLQVTVTPTSPLGALWVDKGRDHFTVHAEGAGTFDWRVVAKRRGLEDARLEPYGHAE